MSVAVSQVKCMQTTTIKAAHPQASLGNLPLQSGQIFKRCADNPIIEASALPIRARTVFNPGAVKLGNEYIIMADVTLPSSPIIFWIFRSRDGVHFTPDPQPVNWPAPDPIHEEHCVYDPRITYMESEGRYLICYASQAHTGVRVGIVETADFKTFKRIAIASENENRNAALFPEKINGLYARFDRPFEANESGGAIWISYSPDLVFWGKSQPVLKTREGFWDHHKVGAGAVPIKTSEGWLEIYHGVLKNCNGLVYQLGVCLLDLEDPSTVIARGTYPVFTPETIYEQTGYVPNVVFTTNAIVENDGMVKIYYGAADTCIGLATAKLSDLITACKF